MTRTRPIAIAVACVLALSASSLIAATAPAQPAGKTASQFFMEYRAAFAEAKKIEDLMPYMSKETRAKMEATPAADRTMMFELLKMVGAITQVKIVKEAQTATGVTLTVEALDPDKKKATGTIDLVKEEGAWKIANEGWSSSS